MHGWLILDKPSGITSAHAVAKVKRLLSSWRGEAEAIPLLNPDNTAGLPRRSAPRNDIKIGHAGTLDPLASGILPLALGEATKTVPYLMDARKSYHFTVTWGQERDTDDAQGQVTRESDMRPSLADIEVVLPNFTGKISQLPPDYSALKLDGKRAYELARAGQAVELKPRDVEVYSLSVIPCPQGGRELETSFICHCSKGTYVRSLARDMGRQLGCYGYISALRRLSVGQFDESHAISLESLLEMRHKGDLGFMRPLSSALDDIPVLEVTERQAASLKHGQPIAVESAAGIAWARLDGLPVAVCERKDDLYWPSRVFNLP